MRIAIRPVKKTPPPVAVQMRDGELCDVVLNGLPREAIWDAGDRLFYFTDDAPPLVCSPEDADEWMPATAPF